MKKLIDSYGILRYRDRVNTLLYELLWYFRYILAYFCWYTWPCTSFEIITKSGKSWKIHQFGWFWHKNPTNSCSKNRFSICYQSPYIFLMIRSCSQAHFIYIKRKSWKSIFFNFLTDQPSNTFLKFRLHKKLMKNENHGKYFSFVNSI